MINIKKATLRDTELIVALGKQTFIESHGHSAPKPDIDAFLQKYYSTTAVTKELKNPKVAYHLITSNNLTVGFSKIEFCSPDN